MEDLYDDWPTGRNVLVTACMIVRDEEELLPAAIASLQHVYDQLVVVDTGSKDRTKQIARLYGEVYDYEWQDDFAAARNYAECYVRGDYILWIDADEILESGHDEIRAIVREGKLDAVIPMLRYNVDEQGYCQTTRTEMLRKRGYGRWAEPVHEYVSLPSPGVIRQAIVYRHQSRTVARGWDAGSRLDECRRRADEQPSIRTYMHLVRELFTLNDYDNALDAAEKALACEGAAVLRAEACIAKGMAHMQRQEAGLAIDAYRDAVREYDQWPESFYFLGAAYALCGEYRMALPWLVAATMVQPTTHSPFGLLSWRRYATLAPVYRQLGMTEQADKAMSEAQERGAPEEVYAAQTV